MRAPQLALRRCVTGLRVGSALSHTGPGCRRWGRCVSKRQQRHVKMPVYQFAVKWDDDQTPDVRYTHLANEEAARRYAKLLIHELASSGFYSSRPCVLEVKDENGPLFSMRFQEAAS